jgi:2'-5' RNA ligase
MRLFIASPVILNNYSTIRDDFEDIIEGKWVKKEHLHLTWVFLGNRTDEASIIGRMQSIRVLEREAKITGVGHFGRPPRLLFANAADKILHSKATEFKEAGFDLHHFKPHITLCRIKRIHDYHSYKKLMNKYAGKALGTVKREIVLYESRLYREGPDYLIRWKND